MTRLINLGSIGVCLISFAILAGIIQTGHGQGVQRRDVVPLLIQAASSQSAAAPGGRQSAFLVLAVNDERGPVSSLTKDNIIVDTLLPPPKRGQACEIVLGDVSESEIARGSYQVELVSLRCDWHEGRYLLSVLVNGSSGSGVGVSELVIKS